MSVFRPFKAWRPKPEEAGLVASKPYDVLNSDEAREEVKDHPLSFLHVGKPEVDLDPSIDLYSPEVYQKGKENLQKLIDEGHLIEDKAESFYVYAQTMNGKIQYGLVGCASVDDYWNDIIKKHEKTRASKEEDRCNHVRVTNAHSGPIFLTYPDNAEIDAIVADITKNAPENDHIAADGIRHQSWVITDPAVNTKIQEIFASIPALYIADGHHRSASAGRVGRERQQANPNHNGTEEYNYFLAVSFPASQLYIMDYNRVVKDLNGHTKDEFFEFLKKNFTITQSPCCNSCAYHPKAKGEFGMYIDHTWYKLETKPALLNNPDPVEVLDVAILQREVLAPYLGIDDPRTSNRIDFVGGIRGLGELERRVDSGEMEVAFAMFATSVNELISIADAGQIMPPKSTWFEPKLRDGLFVHFLD
ncbi:MAG: DUF1015 family protein [bacterium]